MLPFSFRHPSNILLVGPTGAGKTQFLLKALEAKLFQPPPTRIVWVYAEWQPAYDTVQGMSRVGSLPKVEFVKDETDWAGIYESLQPSDRNLLVLDDQMTETKADASSFANIFTKGSHHRSITVVFLIQNLFEKGGALRTVNLNSQYIVLFKNPRDKRQISVLAQQMEPRNSRFIQDAFSDATAKPHGYLVFDLRQETPEELRLITNVDSEAPIVYAPSR